MRIKHIPPNMDGQICDSSDVAAVLEPFIQEIDRGLTSLTEWGQQNPYHETHGALGIVSERAAKARGMTKDAADRRLYDIRKQTYMLTSQSWTDAFLIGCDASPDVLNDLPSFPGTKAVAREMVDVMYEHELSEKECRKLAESLYHFTKGFFTDWDQDFTADEMLVAVAA